ncbi:DUF389 domain-containing protein [Telluribacter sp.]|jgi:uncharacterized hydrophobic protein (TIGR00271 family)|uniref:DUF389 domain-containing protein n=1 Tax=Telluribacter sp. TaxID=1978767 RepID=UPI002E14CC68|nr:DUF389 domain-containing protein [Telluribacter sp.]
MKKKISKYLDLESDIEDYDRIHETIERDINFKGTNLWILSFAIIVASVGLNMNSTAVVIGAMLISPLMGPINGMGYSIATYNFPLFRRAFNNFVFAVGASLLASTLYFAISPVSTAYSELLARTSPTIYDVVIALFGGLAGIVAISSRFKGNVIPGVAIATALMPPLCTAGYGLATGQFTYFFGAFYLFMINTVYIAISSIVISQILKFPIRTVVEDAQKKRINRWITIVIIFTLIPSIYFGYELVQRERFNENAGRFVRSVGVFEGNYLLNQEINPANKTIRLTYGGSMITDGQRSMIAKRARDFFILDTQLQIEQGFSFANERENINEIDKLKGEINRLTMLLSRKDSYNDSLQTRMALGKQLLQEIKPLYPQIVSCSYAETRVYNDKSSKFETIALVVFETDKTVVANADKTRINNWLKRRLNTEAVKSYFDT